MRTESIRPLCAVVITALPIERAAVLEHLREVTEEAPLRGSIYRRGRFEDPAASWDIVVAEIGTGNEAAAAEGATFAYVISLMLTRIARSDSTPPLVRETILNHLTRAANDPQSRRGVYAIFGLGNNDSPLAMEHVVQLDQAFFRAVVQITSGAALA